MLKWFRVALFFFCGTFVLTGQVKDNIQSLLEKENLSGAVWTLIRNDSLEIGAAGYKNLETKQKMHSSDKVHVGSITKTVLALGVLKLATEHKLDLEDPIQNHIKSLPIENPWDTTDPITIRHLLDHTSGLSDLRLWHFLSSSSAPDTPLSAFYTINPDVLQVQARPGTLFSYSNMGYTLLGMVIEEVTGQPYETYLDEHLLKPLGMLESTFQFKSQVGAHKDNQLAMGHFDNGQIVQALPIYLRPAGQFTTTAKDMGSLIKFILNKGKISNDQIIKRSYFEVYGKPNYTIAFQKGLSNGYAFGLASRDRYGVVGLNHSGNIVGYKAMLYIFPEENKGFFISHNMDSEIADYGGFTKAFIDELDIPKSEINIGGRESTGDFNKWEGYYVPTITKVVPLMLLDMVGSYTKIELTDFGINITSLQGNVMNGIHRGNGLFQIQDRVLPSHLLYEVDNEHYMTTGLSTVRKTSGWKILLCTLSLLLGLIGMVLILCSGIFQLIKYKGSFFMRPIVWVFFATVMLCLAMALITTKNILYIGDANLGAITLYLATMIFPLAVAISLISFIRSANIYQKNWGFWATVALAQFSLLLLLFELIPFSTWK